MPAAAPSGPRADLPVLPSYEDPVVRGASELLGGPPGRHARLGERRFWQPVRWLLLLTLVTCGLGLWQKAPCRVHPWTHEYQYTRGCYSDVLALWYAEGLDRGETPYLDHPVEYPVVIGAVMGVTAAFTDVLATALPASAVDRAEDAVDVAERSSDGDRPARVDAALVTLAAAEAADRARSFYDLSWVLLTGCALVVTVTTARLAGRRRVWDAALFAVAPGLLLHATTNWDLVATAFAGLGLLAWARRRPVVAGVLLGFGTAAKLYPVLFLVPLLALCWRADRLRAGLQTATALLLTAAALVVPVYLASPSFVEVAGSQVRMTGSAWDRVGAEGLAGLAPHTRVAAAQGPGTVEAVNAVYRFVELNQRRPADWDTLPYVLQNLRDDRRLRWHGVQLNAPFRLLARVLLGTGATPGSTPTHLNRSVAVGVLVTLGLVVLLAVRAPRRPRLPQLLFLTVTGFLLANKVFSPQYVLWLLPLAALARPRWGPFLAWQAAEVFLLFTRFYYFVSLPQGAGDSTSEGIDVWWFLGAVLLRDVLLVMLAVAVVRDVLHPERDVVRAAGDSAADDPADDDPADDDPARDDPAGGVLDAAPDRQRDRGSEPLAPAASAAGG